VEAPIALGVGDDALDHDVVGVAAQLLVAEVGADLGRTRESATLHEGGKHVHLDLRHTVPTGDRRIPILGRALPQAAAKSIGWCQRLLSCFPEGALPIGR